MSGKFGLAEVFKMASYRVGRSDWLKHSKLDHHKGWRILIGRIIQKHIIKCGECWLAEVFKIVLESVVNSIWSKCSKTHREEWRILIGRSIYQREWRILVGEVFKKTSLSVANYDWPRYSNNHAIKIHTKSGWNLGHFFEKSSIVAN